MSRISNRAALVAAAAIFAWAPVAGRTEVLEFPADIGPLLCVLQPEGCDDGPQLQLVVDPDYGFLGLERFRVAGHPVLLDPALLGVQVFQAGIFFAEDEEHVIYKGAWLPAGTNGRSFRLVLDAASRAALESKISAGCSAAAGEPILATLIGTPKLLLETNEDGSEATLRVSAKGSAAGRKVRYRARLEGQATSLPAPLP
jgi:hypothetical protein